MVISLEAVQSERLRADIAESLLHGTQDALHNKIEDMFDSLLQERERADAAEAYVSTLRQETEDLKSLSQVHEEVAVEATRRAEASEAVKRKLQEELKQRDLSNRPYSQITPVSIRVIDAVESMPIPYRRKMQAVLHIPVGAIDDARKGLTSRVLSNGSGSEVSRQSTFGDEESLSPQISSQRPLPASELLTMVQASAEEVLHAQINLGLEKQANAQLKARVQALEDELSIIGSERAELNALRVNERALRHHAENSVQEAERLKVADAVSKKRLSEMQLSLHTATLDRDRLGQALAAAAREASELRESEAEASSKANSLEHELRNFRVEMSRVRAATEDEQKELLKAREQYGAQKVEAKRFQDEKRLLEAEFQTYQEYHGTGDQQQLKALAKMRFQVDTLSRQVDATESELGAQQSSTEQMRAHIVSLEEQVRVLEIQRRELHNQNQELKGNIRVFCRVRPVPDFTELSLYLPGPNKLNLTHADESYSYEFDKVFGFDSQQADIYDEVDGLVQSALDGYKVSIFAYGQTGSGKTYTMQGTDEPGCWGLIPRSLSKIFQSAQSMRSQGWHWSLQCSILEVYNENLRDLLRGGGDNAAGPAPVHNIQHHEAWGTIVTNMTCVEVTSLEQITGLTARAAKQRSVGSTCMNAVSSRSHSVFCLYLTGTNQLLGHELFGALHLVDLSGSERLDKSGASGDRLKETQSINKSLSSLTDVFVAKAEGRPHIPFRNSKLTYLMEPCFSGQGKTLMVVNVRPERSNSHESLCSLRFAKQVNQCNTGGKPRRTLKERRVSKAPTSGELAGPSDLQGGLPKTPRGRSRSSTAREVELALHTARRATTGSGVLASTSELESEPFVKVCGLSSRGDGRGTLVEPAPTPRQRSTSRNMSSGYGFRS